MTLTGRKVFEKREKSYCKATRCDHDWALMQGRESDQRQEKLRDIVRQIPEGQMVKDLEGHCKDSRFRSKNHEYFRV